jgi:hypothetical protein
MLELVGGEIDDPIRAYLDPGVAFPARAGEEAEWAPVRVVGGVTGDAASPTRRHPAVPYQHVAKEQARPAASPTRKYVGYLSPRPVPLQPDRFEKKAHGARGRLEVGFANHAPIGLRPVTLGQ